jgi:iron complex transport system ATP-binding protein
MSIIYSIKGLSFSYPSLDRKVLSNVSLDIYEGEVLSVLGRNGAGKSTLLSCMLGLNTPQEGEISLHGKNLRDMSEREIACAVGYVPQTHTPSFGHTVFDFVQMGCANRVGLFSRPGRKERSDTAAVLSEMGIENLANRPYTELSGGERQQAIIARAIVSHPRIILFDEPTAHLDLGNQLRVLRLIKQFSEKGFAVVITTHNPDHALLLGGSTAIIDNDGCLSFGKTDDIVTTERLKSVYGSALSIEYIEHLGRRVCLLPNL